MKVTCKFKCDSVTILADGKKNFEFSPVYNNSEENKSFWQFTPSGKLSFICVNPDVSFQPGNEYYLDITPATQVGV